LASTVREQQAITPSEPLDAELVRQTLRAIKELQAGLADEMETSVDGKIRSISDQLHKETQSTTESMVKVAEVLGEKIDRLTVRVDEGVGGDMHRDRSHDRRDPRCRRRAAAPGPKFDDGRGSLALRHVSQVHRGLTALDRHRSHRLAHSSPRARAWPCESGVVARTRPPADLLPHRDRGRNCARSRDRGVAGPRDGTRQRTA
jgi:hypothetical protein